MIETYILLSFFFAIYNTVMFYREQFTNLDHYQDEFTLDYIFLECFTMFVGWLIMWPFLVIIRLRSK